MFRKANREAVLDIGENSSAMAEATGPVLDVEFCRNHFPNLKDGWAYFENAGGSYLPQSVVDVTVKYMTECRTQPNPHYAGGAAAKVMIEGAQQALADMLGVRLSELVFGANTTINFYVLAQGLRKNMSAGDEIIVTNQDHEANIGCWRRLSDTGIVIKEWQVNPKTGLLSIDDLRSLLTDRTKLVCFTHASNIVAAVNDVEVISKLAHDKGALVCVDGVAYCPHAPLHLKEWGVDFYGFSLYKMYGPHLGIMYCKEDVIAAHAVSNQNHYFLDGLMPPMLNPGGRLYASVAAVAGVVDYITAVHRHHFEQDDSQSPYSRYCQVFDLFAAHEEQLGAYLVKFLSSKVRVRILGPTACKRSVRMPTFAFVVDGTKPLDVAKAVSESKLAIGGGSHFYAARLAESMEFPDGVVRVSMVHYNTLDETRLLCEALQRIVS